MKNITFIRLLVIVHLNFIITIPARCSTIAQSHEKYVIGTWRGAGLCVNFNSVLNHIGWCEDNNRTPVVYWDHVSPYYVSQGFNGSDNVWEYYFEPVSHLAYESEDIIHRYHPDGRWAFNYFAIDPINRSNAHYFISKYIKIKPIVQAKIDHFYQQYMTDRNTIGIHLRGTDKKTEEKLVSPETMINTALKYADSNTQFLIASDDQRLLDKMIQLLPKHKVIYYDCYRSENDKPLHEPYRKPSFAQLGEDVLVEVSLLAKCTRLIHTYSNVSATILYFNPTMPNVLVR